jgi:hypothetical protein
LEKVLHQAWKTILEIFPRQRIARRNDNLSPAKKENGSGESRRRLDIPTGQKKYRALKVKLILLMTNDQKTKNVIKFNQDF